MQAASSLRAVCSPSFSRPSPSWRALSSWRSPHRGSVSPGLSGFARSTRGAKNRLVADHGCHGMVVLDGGRTLFVVQIQSAVVLMESVHVVHVMLKALQRSGSRRGQVGQEHVVVGHFVVGSAWDPKVQRIPNARNKCTRLPWFCAFALICADLRRGDCAKEASPDFVHLRRCAPRRSLSPVACVFAAASERVYGALAPAPSWWTAALLSLSLASYYTYPTRAPHTRCVGKPLPRESSRAGGVATVLSADSERAGDGLVC
jgi:hypothetical protein